MKALLWDCKKKALEGIDLEEGDEVKDISSVIGGCIVEMADFSGNIKVFSGFNSSEKSIELDDGVLYGNLVFVRVENLEYANLTTKDKNIVRILLKQKGVL